MTSSSSAPTGEVWKCIDDGSGRGKIYISFPSGEKVRVEPPGFQPEIFCNGENRYYYKGTCIRCRDQFCPSVISRNMFEVVFALNICDRCILNGIQSCRMRGSGDEIWDKFTQDPKICLFPIRQKYLNSNREIEIYERTLEAKLYVGRGSKHRRNLMRAPGCYKLTLSFEGMENLTPDSIGGKQEKSSYISWGFFGVYDEYFGEIKGFEGSATKLSRGVPNGKGVKYYSDGSTYCGEWISGVPYTEKTGIMTLSDGTVYEGQWVNGKRHGQGKQTYPDGAVYVGQFADGYEHGTGNVTYSDKSYFEGRFRFGRRDGPGIFSSKSGKIERGNFKDKSLYYNFTWPPEIVEGKEEELILRDIENGALKDIHVQPPSLLHATAHVLSKLMHVKEYRKNFLSGKKFKSRTPDYIRDSVVSDYLETYHGDARAAKFREKARLFAFIDCPVVSISSVKIDQDEAETFFYFIAANELLDTLQLNINKLQLTSIEALGLLLRANTWPNLCTLDLSYNEFGPDPSTGAVSLSAICTNCRLCPRLMTLKLAGCNIISMHAPIIADLIDQSFTLLTLDLSFNLLRGEGAEVLADSIRENKTLTSLNLRKNEIGAIGGASIAEAMEFNHTLKVLNLSDNSVGNAVVTLISGRISGNVLDVSSSVCMKELIVPLRYEEGRYDHIELKRIMRLREESTQRRLQKSTQRIKTNEIVVMEDNPISDHTPDKANEATVSSARSMTATCDEI